MKQLIRDLLNYSSLENTGESFVTTDLNETLKNVLKDFELRIEENDAIVRSDELLTIVAVHLQMNQLFSNLLSNSLKFSRQGVPPVINISNKIFSAAELIKHPNLNQSLSYFEIIFKDNGIGFSQKYAEQVFTIFQRLNARSEYPGTGIGLALCKKIVENHQGEIYAEAKENKGAVFHIILPLQQTKISAF
jgi:two-component system CheB/CheR fusion protein